MSITIHTNTAARHAQVWLATNQAALTGAFGQLASGLRVSRSADDAARLSISQNITSKINGISQAAANVADATAITDIADGALGTVHDVLQRMYRLVLGAANAGAVDTGAVVAAGSEVAQLIQYLNTMAVETRGNGTPLLDGSFVRNFQVGAVGGDIVTLDLSNANVHARNLGGGSGEWTNIAPAGEQPQWRWIGDTSGVDLTKINLASFTVGYQPRTYTEGTGWSAPSATPADGYLADAAASDLRAIRDAMASILRARTDVGSVAGRLQYTADTLQTQLVALSGTRSTLLDADLAEQTTALARSAILSVSSAAVLAQANSLPKAVLQLLDDAVANDAGSRDAGSGEAASDDAARWGGAGPHPESVQVGPSRVDGSFSGPWMGSPRAFGPDSL